MLENRNTIKWYISMVFFTPLITKSEKKEDLNNQFVYDLGISTDKFNKYREQNKYNNEIKKEDTITHCNIVYNRNDEKISITTKTFKKKEAIFKDITGKSVDDIKKSCELTDFKNNLSKNLNNLMPNYFKDAKSITILGYVIEKNSINNVFFHVVADVEYNTKKPETTDTKPATKPETNPSITTPAQVKPQITTTTPANPQKPITTTTITKPEAQPPVIQQPPQIVTTIVNPEANPEANPQVEEEEEKEKEKENEDKEGNEGESEEENGNEVEQGNEEEEEEEEEDKVKVEEKCKTGKTTKVNGYSHRGGKNS